MHAIRVVRCPHGLMAASYQAIIHCDYQINPMLDHFTFLSFLKYRTVLSSTHKKIQTKKSPCFINVLYVTVCVLKLAPVL